MYFKVLLIYGSERIMGNMALHNKWRGGTLGISRWGCAAGTMEPLPYARASLELSAYLQ